MVITCALFAAQALPGQARISLAKQVRETDQCGQPSFVGASPPSGDRVKCWMNIGSVSFGITSLLFGYRCALLAHHLRL